MTGSLGQIPDMTSIPSSRLKYQLLSFPTSCSLLPMHLVPIDFTQSSLRSWGLLVRFQKNFVWFHEPRES
ncbi:hypothetical protein HBI25_080980 [Parastagonospora nodorum]|nr:hypothetical protein HBH50_172240 [Parastagonospora nodorum]KAH4083718.1 hypothetical protein HBH48_169850 [Parastagonospora nodorum]KAH4163974.1 hypothetical protein HBH43_149220 [Parastagonospora nodorum]KAH4204249.1 hypothetical protein HBI95_150210 [Parastagonospora nodorum]KAH4406764.1 hypothetical protein HBH92_162370 [Parastagonospora nodorum]